MDRDPSSSLGAIPRGRFIIGLRCRHGPLIEIKPRASHGVEIHVTVIAGRLADKENCATIGKRETCGTSIPVRTAFCNQIGERPAIVVVVVVATVGSSIGKKEVFQFSNTCSRARSKNVARRKSRSRITNVGRTFMFHGHPVAPSALSRLSFLSPSSRDQHPRSTREEG